MKRRPSSAQRGRNLFFEHRGVSNSDRAVDAGSFGGHFKVGFTGGHSRMADIGPAVGLVIEHNYDQVCRILIRKRRQVE